MTGAEAFALCLSSPIEWFRFATFGFRLCLAAGSGYVGHTDRREDARDALQ
jgi:hypothetical protein